MPMIMHDSRQIQTSQLPFLGSSLQLRWASWFGARESSARKKRRGGISDFLIAGAGFSPALPKSRRSRRMNDQIELITARQRLQAPILAQWARFVLSTRKNTSV
jgi:hypothetical protein